MRIYLDEDISSALLVTLLRKAGQQVRRSVDAGMAGKSDPEHFLYCIQQNEVLLTHNHVHFERLHRLVIGSGGHHPGAMAVRLEKDRTKNMKPAAIISAIRKLESAGVPIVDQLHILNHWR